MLFILAYFKLCRRSNVVPEVGQDVLNSQDVSVIGDSNAAKDTVKGSLPAIAIVGMVVFFLVIAVIIGCLIRKKCRKTGNLGDAPKKLLSEEDYEKTDFQDDKKFENIQILSENPITIVESKYLGVENVKLLQQFLNNSFTNIVFIHIDIDLGKFTVDNIKPGSNDCNETCESIKRFLAKVNKNRDFVCIKDATLLFRKEISQQYAPSTLKEQ